MQRPKKDGKKEMMWLIIAVIRKWMKMNSFRRSWKWSSASDLNLKKTNLFKKEKDYNQTAPRHLITTNWAGLNDGDTWAPSFYNDSKTDEIAFKNTNFSERENLMTDTRRNLKISICAFFSLSLSLPLLSFVSCSSSRIRNKRAIKIINSLRGNSFGSVRDSENRSDESRLKLDSSSFNCKNGKS